MTKKTGERVSAALVSRLRGELAAWKAKAESDANALRREREAHASSKDWLGRHQELLNERKDEAIRLAAELGIKGDELAEEKRKRSAALAASAEAQLGAGELRAELGRLSAELETERAARRLAWDDSAAYAEALIIRCGQEPQLHALARVSVYRGAPGRMAVELRLESAGPTDDAHKVPPAESMRMELDAGSALMMGTELHAELAAVMRRAMRIGGGR